MARPSPCLTRRTWQLERLEDRSVPALITWDGGGADNNWTTAANWVDDRMPAPGDSLRFPDGGALKLTSVNNFPAGTTFEFLSVQGSGYQISGNAVTLTLGAGVSGPVGTSTIALAMAGPAGLNKIEPVTLVLSGANTYTGLTFVDGGEVSVEGAVAGPVLVNAGILRGSGTVGAVEVRNGAVDPGALVFGDPTGVLTTGGLNFNPTGTEGVNYNVFLQNTSTGLDADQLAVRGTVRVGGKLNINTISFSHSGPLNLGTVTIIDNDGTDAVQGTFNALPEGAIIPGVRDKAARISYKGGDGNDVTLTVVDPATVPLYTVAAGPGFAPLVNLYHNDGAVVRNFLAYDQSFRGGVRVALADFNGDGSNDVVTAPGPGGGPHIKVFNGATGALIREFLAYSNLFRGGVFVGAGDVTGDGTPEIITGAGAGGGPHVKIFNGATGAVVREFMAYEVAFTGGVTVAAGDLTNDGRADVITGAGPGGGPHVRIFDAVSGRDVVNIFAYDVSFRGGVNVAFYRGILGGNGFLTAPASGGGPDVRLWLSHGLGDVVRFNAYAPNFFGGVTIAAHDIDADGRDEVFTGAGPGGGPHVKAFRVDGGSGVDTRLSFNAFDPSFTGGVFVG